MRGRIQVGSSVRGERLTSRDEGLRIGRTKEYDRIENWHRLVLLEKVLGGFVALFPEAETGQGSLEPFSFERRNEDSL